MSAPARPDDAPPTRSYQWTVIGVLFVFYMIAYLDKKLITLLIVPIRESFGVGDFEMSLVTGTAFVVFYVLFSVPIGWAVDRFSRRNLIFAGVVTWSLFAALGGFTRNYWQLLLTRCGVGAGEAVLGPAGNSLIADVVPRARLTQATAATHAGALAGSALAFALGGLLLSFVARGGPMDLPLLGRHEPWQLVMIVTGLPGLLIAFLAFAIREPRRTGIARRAAGSGRGAALRYLWTNRSFYGPHFLGFGLLSVATAGFAGWMPTHMIRNYDVPVASLGAVLAMLQLSFGAVGMFLPTILIDRLFGRGRIDAHFHLFGWAALAMGAAGILVGIAPNAWLAFCGIALVDMMVGFLPAAGAALQLATPNRYRGQATAMFLIAYNVFGQAGGPIAVAAITDFLFRDEAMVGVSLALMFAVVAPLSAWLLLRGRAAMRAAVGSVQDG